MTINNESIARPLVLYGAGGGCEFAFFTCFTRGITVSCVCDSKRNGTYQDKYTKSSYEIISPAQLLDEYQHANVLITSYQYELEIRKYLDSLGYPKDRIFSLLYPFLMDLDVFCENYLPGYRWAYDLFADQLSKQHVLDRIKLHLLGYHVPGDSNYKEGYFGYPGITLHNGEIYVDGGAFDGDSAEEFIYAMEQKASLPKNEEIKYHIYAFEPDPANYVLANEKLKNIKGINLIQCGLSNSECEILFNADNTIGAGIIESPNNSQDMNVINVPVTSLDNFFGGKQDSELPTIIKMDIEGAEKNALIGAAEIIRKTKPRLIICAYHKPEDIYELPQVIMNIRDDYNMRLWQIGDSFWDMVLYAD